MKKALLSVCVAVPLLLLGGCATATRPINPPITQADPKTGYRFEARQTRDKDNLVILEPPEAGIEATSGGENQAAPRAPSEE